jgi:hypothetical protein
MILYQLSVLLLVLNSISCAGSYIIGHISGRKDSMQYNVTVERFSNRIGT